MRLPLVLVGSVAVLLAFALALNWVPLPRPLPEPGSHARQLPAAVATALLGLALMTGVAWSEVAPVLRARGAVDAAMAAEGLTTRRYLVVGRSYSGQVDRRTTEVLYVPGARGQHGLVEIRVAASSGFRAALGRSRPLLECRDCPAFGTELEGVGPLRAATDDCDRLAALMGEDQVRVALARLLRDEDGPTGRELYLLPERVWLRCHVEPGGEGKVPRLLHAVAALAEVVDTVSSAEDAHRQ